jgi:hypothetical protein
VRAGAATSCGLHMFTVKGIREVPWCIRGALLFAHQSAKQLVDVMIEEHMFVTSAGVYNIETTSEGARQQQSS